MTKPGFAAAALAAVLLATPVNAKTEGVNVKNPEDIAASLNVETAFAVELQCENGTAPSTCQTTVNVPAGHRWVIKTISGYCNFGTASGNKLALVFVQTKVGSVSPVIFPTPSAAVPFAGVVVSSFVFSGEGYADAGTQVQFQASTAQSNGPDGFACTTFLQGQSISN